MSDDTENPIETDAFLVEPGAVLEGLRLGGVGVWRWQIDSEKLEWTRNLESVHNLDPGSFDGGLSSFERDLHPEDVNDVWNKIKQTIETGAPYRALYRTAPKPNKPEIWVQTSGGVTFGPNGSRFLTGVCLDVSDRIRSEKELLRRLSQQRAVASFSSYALNENDFQKVLDAAVLVAAEVLSVPLTKVLQFAAGADHLVLRAGIGWMDGLVGHGTVGIDQASQAGYTLLEKAPVIVKDMLDEIRFNGPPLLFDHKVRSGMSVVIPGTEVRPFGVFGIHDRELRNFDQTDAQFLQSLANIVAGAARQAVAAEHHTLLVREMSHRAGNMMQLVNSIARQTFTANADMQLAKYAFSERLKALAHSNFVVSQEGWKSTRFAKLFDETLKPFGGRVTKEGLDILLPPELSFDMGLVLHELATNSVKYGTLGKSFGNINAKWAVQSRLDGSNVFTFDWDDPLSLPETPTTGSGFGSKLMKALIGMKWKGVIVVERSPHFKFNLEVPVPKS